MPKALNSTAFSFQTSFSDHFTIPFPLNYSDSSSTDADVDWLTSSEAASCFETAQSAMLRGDELVVIAKLLRKSLTASRCQLVLSQVQLRQRARTKFDRASQMFFTDRALQQATGQGIAAYKAKKFSKLHQLYDLCCGIGGDSIELARRAPVIGIDNDSQICKFAVANCSANEVSAEILCQDVDLAKFPADSWVHVDPDRRRDAPKGRGSKDFRTTRLEQFSPDLDFMKELVRANRNVAIKVAPASRVPRDFAINCEKEWIGDLRECKQQVLWFNDLARGNGQRTATCVDSKGQLIGQFICHRQVPTAVEVTDKVGDVIHEPHATIIAARMVDSLAVSLGLKRIHSDVAYLTGPLVVHPLLKRFRVIDRSKLDLRSINRMLVLHDVGELEVKRRGVEQRWHDELAQVRLKGARKLTLILTKWDESYLAILAKREVK